VLRWLYVFSLVLSNLFIDFCTVYIFHLLLLTLFLQLLSQHVKIKNLIESNWIELNYYIVVLLYLWFLSFSWAVYNWPSGCWCSTLIIKNWIIFIIIIIISCSSSTISLTLQKEKSRERETETSTSFSNALKRIFVYKNDEEYASKGHLSFNSIIGETGLFSVPLFIEVYNSFYEQI
jgi:hypothetical protein